MMSCFIDWWNSVKWNRPELKNVFDLWLEHSCAVTYFVWTVLSFPFYIIRCKLSCVVVLFILYVSILLEQTTVELNCNYTKKILVHDTKVVKRNINFKNSLSELRAVCAGYSYKWRPAVLMNIICQLTKDYEDIVFKRWLDLEHSILLEFEEFSSSFMYDYVCYFVLDFMYNWFNFLLPCIVRKVCFISFHWLNSYLFYLTFHTSFFLNFGRNLRLTIGG